VKARIYLALTALFAAAALVTRTVAPHRLGLVVWNGLLAIGFRYAAASAKIDWQTRRESE
jgi:hypothetical protein